MGINATLIAQMIAFAVFIFLTMKFLWPPIIKALEQRRAKIQEGLEAAERGEMALAEARNEALGIVREAREKAGEIVKQAEQRVGVLADEGRERAKREAEIILEAARAQIQVELKEARARLKQELASLAVLAAGRVLDSELDEKKHRELISDFANRWN